jgi:TDG/mug DNA glycosylase family protein
MTDKHVLLDILVPQLDVVIVGSAVGPTSAGVGHYYAASNNRFWVRLHEAGLTPRVLNPEEDASLPAFGIGLTDLNKTDSQANDDGLEWDVQGFLERLTAAPPKWVVFNGMGVARNYADALGLPEPKYGLQAWTIGESRGFVVPNSSGQNGANRMFDGKTTLKWWVSAGQHVAQTREVGMSLPHALSKPKNPSQAA